jgi:hypothetical protein
MQAAISSGSHEAGLAAVSLATLAVVFAAWRCSQSVGFRWCVADAVLWIWVAGLLTKAPSFVPLVAVAVRASVFPFHTGLTTCLRTNAIQALPLAVMTPAIWAYRWMDKPQVDPFLWLSLLLAIAALTPAILAAFERSTAAATAYRLVSASLWPIIHPMSTQACLALYALATLAIFGDASTVWRRVASASAVMIPTLHLVLATRTLSFEEFLAWCVVTVSTVLFHTARPSSLHESSGPHWLKEVSVAVPTLLAWLALAAAWTGSTP